MGEESDPGVASVDAGGGERFGGARGVLESCDGREILASGAPRRWWAPRGSYERPISRAFARRPSETSRCWFFLARRRLLSRHWTMHTTPLDDDKVTSYYEPFYGHDVEHLALALSALRRRHDSVVFLAGDSSLDNKYWFSSWADAVNGYETVLEPPRMKRDVCYWINEQAEREGKRLGCLNAAVEATSLNDRAWGRLLPQDAFIRDHMTEDDVLVVSVGGNDVALSPLLCTAVNLAVLVCCVPRPCLERGACASPPNVNALVDCGCCGCGVPGCVAGLAGWPPGCVPITRTSARRVHLRPLFSPSRRISPHDPPRGLVSASPQVRIPGRLVQESRAKLRSATVRRAKTETSARVHHLLPRGARQRELGGRGALPDAIQRRPGEAPVRHPADLQARHQPRRRPRSGGGPRAAVRGVGRARRERLRTARGAVRRGGKEDGGGVSPQAPRRKRTVVEAMTKDRREGEPRVERLAARNAETTIFWRVTRVILRFVRSMHSISVRLVV